VLLDDAFPPFYGKVTKYAHTFRRDVHKRFKNNPEKMARCFERFLATDWKKVIKDLSNEEVKEELNKLLEDSD